MLQIPSTHMIASALIHVTNFRLTQSWCAWQDDEPQPLPVVRIPEASAAPREHQSRNLVGQLGVVLEARGAQRSRNLPRLQTAL